MQNTIQNNDTTVAVYERLVTRLGLPSVLIGVFLLFYSGWFSSPVTRMEAALAAHVVSLASHEKSTADQLAEVRKQTRLLFRVCQAAKGVQCGEALLEVSPTVVLTPPSR